MSTCLMWKDSNDHETIHIGKRYGGRIVTWASVMEDGIKELFGEEMEGLVSIMHPGEIHVVELTAAVRG